jgi:hypothetical protein
MKAAFEMVVPSTVMVLLSMLVFSIHERFQASGKGPTHAFMDGVVWRLS